MATVIKASCHDCGDVELGVGDLEVRVCTQDDHGTYVFRCPSCQMSVVKPAEPRIVDMLVASGVQLSSGDCPPSSSSVEAAIRSPTTTSSTSTGCSRATTGSTPSSAFAEG